MTRSSDDGSRLPGRGSEHAVLGAGRQGPGLVSDGRLRQVQQGIAWEAGSGAGSWTDRWDSQLRDLFRSGGRDDGTDGVEGTLSSTWTVRFEG